MDRRLEYGELIKSLIREWVASLDVTQNAETEMVCAFDDVNQVYSLTEWGWQGHRRIQLPFYFLRIVNGKIWIEENRTEEDIAFQLVKAGVPNEHIVLGLQPPYMRPRTEYAAA